MPNTVLTPSTTVPAPKGPNKKTKKDLAFMRTATAPKKK